MNRVLTLIVIIAAITTFGCGGGGGAANQAPVINALTAAIAAIWANAATNLTCDATDGDGDNLTYAWAALDGGGVVGNGANATFTAPAVAINGACNVQCTVTDGNGGADVDTVQVAVGATVTGTVVDMTTGFAVQGVVMMVGGMTGTSDVNGNFTILGVPFGNHQVSTAPASDWSVSGAIFVNVTTPGVAFPIGQNVPVFSGSLPPPPPF